MSCDSEQEGRPTLTHRKLFREGKSGKVEGKGQIPKETRRKMKIL